jgi:hypothetical protein
VAPEKPASEALDFCARLKNFGIPETHFRLRNYSTVFSNQRPRRRVDPDAIPASPIVAILDFCKNFLASQGLFRSLRQCQHPRGINPWTRTCGPRIQLFGSICQSGNSNCPDAGAWAIAVWAPRCGRKP